MFTNTLEQEALLNRQDLQGSFSTLGLNPLSDSIGRPTQLSLSSGFESQYVDQASTAFRPIERSSIRSQSVFTATDDYAGNSSTTGTVSIGGSTNGVINFGGDTDWFRVNLVAGTTYQFRNNRTSLADPFLSLRNSSGTLLASNDDGGGNLNSLITYRATYTGLHFLDARAFGSSMTGTY
ncbi:MAG: PPC domain-containing protein, partial [Snowella sp.]|nr:PPC domain-containing protein [Snowella sp.]